MYLGESYGSVRLSVPRSLVLVFGRMEGHLMLHPVEIQEYIKIDVRLPTCGLSTYERSTLSYDDTTCEVQTSCIDISKKVVESSMEIQSHYVAAVKFYRFKTRLNSDFSQRSVLERMNSLTSFSKSRILPADIVSDSLWSVDEFYTPNEAPLLFMWSG